MARSKRRGSRGSIIPVDLPYENGLAMRVGAGSWYHEIHKIKIGGRAVNIAWYILLDKIYTI